MGQVADMTLIYGLVVSYVVLWARTVAFDVPDSKCPVKRIPPYSPLTLVDETPNSKEEVWLKPGPSFERIEFKVLKDVMFDTYGNVPHYDVLFYDRERLSLNETNENNWIRIRFEISLAKKTWKADTYDLKAFANGRTIVVNTGLWWRFVEIKKVQILVKGEAEVTVDCRPPAMQTEFLEQEALKSSPFRYAFWAAIITLALLLMFATIVIVRYCKGKKSHDLTLHELSNSRMDEHIYDEPQELCGHSNFVLTTRHSSGTIENEYDTLEEVTLSAPKLTMESHYVQMNLYKE